MSDLKQLKESWKQELKSLWKKYHTNPERYLERFLKFASDKKIPDFYRGEAYRGAGKVAMEHQLRDDQGYHYLNMALQLNEEDQKARFLLCILYTRGMKEGRENQFLGNSIHLLNGILRESIKDPKDQKAILTVIRSYLKECFIQD